MAEHTDIVARYIAVWNETDATQQQALIARTWTEDAHYQDPLMQADGHAGIATLVQGVQQKFPAFRFRQLGTPDGHDRYLRFAWELGPESGPAPIAGSDVAILADDGRIQQVIGFLDRVPAGAPAAEGEQR